MKSKILLFILFIGLNLIQCKADKQPQQEQAKPQVIDTTGQIMYAYIFQYFENDSADCLTTIHGYGIGKFFIDSISVPPKSNWQFTKILDANKQEFKTKINIQRIKREK